MQDSRNIHDQLYSLRDENIQLKKKMAENDGNTKKFEIGVLLNKPLDYFSRSRNCQSNLAETGLLNQKVLNQLSHHRSVLFVWRISSR